ncbi:MAG: hypothetical protein AAF919_18300 [Pseudomonadota bacterium]
MEGSDEGWERRFLAVLTRAMPDLPPAEGFAFRRDRVRQRWPGRPDAALIVAAAELLEEEGVPRRRIPDYLQAVIREVPGPGLDQVEWLWNAGRGDLIAALEPATPRATGRCRMAIPMMSVPLLAITVSAIACLR